MSRADWSFLERLLEEGQDYSTPIGRVWLTVLFLFRMLVLGTAAESAWDDEQADFVCNTRQPGCTAVCYDRAFPLSHFRYFVLQVIFVSTPTIFYFGYVAVRIGKSHKNKEVQDEKQAGTSLTGKTQNRVTEDDSKEKEKEKSGNKITSKTPHEPMKLKGRLLGLYTLSILFKVLLETGFIVGLWFLYGGFFIAAKFECTASPCPHTVDCFVSRPTEKTIFTVYTQVIAALSLLLNLIELLHLLVRAISLRLEKQVQDNLPRLEEARRDNPEPEGGHIGVPVQGSTTLNTNHRGSNADTAVEAAEVTQGPGATIGADLLPSYVNCMKAMTKPYSNRHQVTKHSKPSERNPNRPIKGQHKHYV
ncbi:gap junction alpha-4 protein [Austrofundulus limnaeus]|uniref:Gap junction protein n=1 Tax=Austrofundulus limnaeus TaxID=52670 RepID=A0A2I4CI00_AUSLI|nr:PREDICTED: gap junction Cx32.2 protein-like [Austrofundulus limnaeus]